MRAVRFNSKKVLVEELPALSDEECWFAFETARDRKSGAIKVVLEP